MKSKNEDEVFENFTLRRLLLLNEIRKEQKVSLADLDTNYIGHKSNKHKIIKTFEEKGYVERGKKDSRKVPIYITVKGIKIIERVKTELEK